MAASDSWPAWAGNGMGVRRTRLLTYSILAATFILGVFVFFQWETIPSLDQLKSQYCDYNPPPPPPPDAPLDDEFDIKPPGPPQKAVTVTATLERTVTQTIQTTVTAASEPVGEDVSKTTEHKPGCIDPYRRPGYLSIDNSTGDYDTTRWIPYTAKFLEAEDPVSAAYPYNSTENGEIWFDWESKVESEYMDDPLTPTNWYNLVLEEARKKKDGEETDSTLSWVYGRVILLVSDSVDRFNTQWFCHEFNARGYDEKAKFGEGGKLHSTAVCTVPSLNFTIVHWHLAGMTTYNPAWWWDSMSIKDVPFEERYDKTWSETFDKIVGKNGKGPDLVVWQSTVWDRKNWAGVAKLHYGNDHPMAKFERHLVWDEIRFYAARVKTLLHFLKEKLGDDVPMMLRTVTLDRTSQGKDNQPYDMDRINRVVGEKLGVEPFEWGRLIAGHPTLYKDSLHPGRGPASWLWSTMMLEYLARAVGAGTAGGAREERAPYFDGWNQCHGELTTIGSNAYH